MDIAVLRLLLENGGDPNVATLNGLTPLNAAALRGDVDAMRLLIDKGANIDAKNGAGATALMGAALNGSAAAVQFLLEKGADARARTKLGETALGNAAGAGSAEAVKLLLDRGADVNSRNDRGYSPLMLAAGSDAVNAEVAKLLIGKGADTSFAADYDETARILASKRGDTEVTRLLGGVAKRDDRQTAVTTHNVATAVRSPQKAIEIALPLLEKQSHNFIRIGGCNSCHAQDLVSAAAGIARDRGIPGPAEIPQLPQSMMASPERLMDLNIVGVTSVAWELFDFGMNKIPKSDYTDAVVRYIKAMQTPAGNWSTNESRRPPMAAGDFQAAALSIYSLKRYAQDSDKAGADAVIAKAVKWLESAKPATTQDRAFHALGLAWGNAAPASITAAARALAAIAAGGWRMEPTSGDGVGRLCHGSGALRAERRRQDGRVQSGLSERHRLPAPDAGTRRHLARRDARDLAAAVFRERISLRPRPVHLGGWNGVGCHGAHASGADTEADYGAVGSADTVSPRASVSARASGIERPSAEAASYRAEPSDSFTRSM